MKILDLCLVTAISLAGISASEASTLLSTGTGDGSLTVEVDLFGNFGDPLATTFPPDPTGAIYDPVGALEADATMVQSFTLFRDMNGTTSLNEVILGNAATLVSASSTEVVSEFSIGALDVRLIQSVISTADPSGALSSSALIQDYQITNTAADPAEFDLFRYADPDLLYDQLRADGGGALMSSGDTVLYVVDANAFQSLATFVGISATGGVANPDGAFEYAHADPNPVSTLPTLLDRLLVIGDDLNETIESDLDGDGVAGLAGDVKMALSRSFVLGSGETQTFTTTTLFGVPATNPATPGSSQGLPLLPATFTPLGGFVFNIPSPVPPGVIYWIDPEIAVGYTYEVLGAEFAAVQAPSLSAIPDSDGYTLVFDGLEIALAPGETYEFGPGVSMFQLLGIDPDLAIDPDDPLGFVTGVSFTNITSSVSVVQTAVRFDTGGGPSAVPLPASVFLLLGGLGALTGLRRRKARA